MDGLQGMCFGGLKGSTRLPRHDARGIAAFRATYPHLNVAEGLVLAPIRESIRLSEHGTAQPWNPDVPPARM